MTASANERLKRILRAGNMFEGKYRILRPLGAGSFAVVVHARHEVMGRDVALKFLKPKVVEQNPEVSERFIKEVQIASKLKHPNVVTIFDFGKTADGIYYMVQEFIDGHTLDEVIDEAPGEVLPMPRVLDIMAQVLSCLEAAHELNIIHRDLKPSNLMSVQREGKEVIKILDFGVAKMLEQGHRGMDARQSTKFIGTPIYMAPEQILGLAVGPSSDLYSVGLMFYEMLTGEAPIEAQQVAEVVQQHLDEFPFAFRSLSRLPKHLQASILKATNRYPEQRFTRASEFALSLDPATAQASAPAPVAQSPPEPEQPERFFGIDIKQEPAPKPQKSSDELDVFLGRNYIPMPEEDYPSSDFNPVSAPQDPSSRPATPARPLPQAPSAVSGLTQMPKELELDMDVVRQVQRERKMGTSDSGKRPSLRSGKHPSSLRGATDLRREASDAPSTSSFRAWHVPVYVMGVLGQLIMYVWITALADNVPAVLRVVFGFMPLIGTLLWVAFANNIKNKSFQTRYAVPMAVRSILVFIMVTAGVFVLFGSRAAVAFVHEGTWGVQFLPPSLLTYVQGAMEALAAVCATMA